MRTFENTWEVTAYELLIEKGFIYLRFMSRKCKPGYCCIEAIPVRGKDCLPSLRKRGAKMAKQFNVPFVDKTA